MCGGVEPEVGERDFPSDLTHAVVVLETETYPEPKVLTAKELSSLKELYGTNGRVAVQIGGSMGFVRDVLCKSKGMRVG